MNESAPDSAGKSMNVPVQRARAGASPISPAEKAFRWPGAWLRFLLPAAVGLAGDLALKAWAFPEGIPAEALAQGDASFGRNPAGVYEPVWFIPHVLGFTTTVNQGAVFGKFQGHVSLFLAFSLVAMGIIVWVFATSGRRQRLVHIALGLIAAGAMGNMYDRAVWHGVRDMLRFSVHWYPYIFNLADVLLCLGVPLLILRWMFAPDARS